MASRFIKGLFSPFRAASFAAHHPRLWFYMCLPMAVAILFLFGFWHIWERLEDPVLLALGGGGEGTWTWFLESLSLVVFGVVSFFVFTATGMVLASPFNDLLCQKVLRLRGWGFIDPPLLKGALIAIMDASKMLMAKIPLFVISFIFPPLALPIFGLIVVLDHFDYPWSHQVKGFRPRLGCLGRDMPEALGFGMSFGLLFAIPFLGLLVLPFSVIGASLLAGESCAHLPQRCVLKTEPLNVHKD